MVHWSDVFAYTTPKAVRIRHKWVGIIYRVAQVMVLNWIIFTQVIRDQGYLKKEVPVGNFDPVLIRPQELQQLSKLDYCQQEGALTDGLRCVSWDPLEMSVVQSSTLFIGTHIKTAIEERTADCDLHTFGCRYWQPVQTDELYVGSIENYTVSLSHQVSASGLGITAGSHTGGESPVLLDQQSSNSTTGIHVDHRDHFTVSQLLQVLNVDLEGHLPNQTSAIRKTGISLLMYVVFGNEGETVTYHYQLQRTRADSAVTRSEMLNATHRRVTTLCGIQISMAAAGTIGYWHLQSLLITIMAGLGMMSLAKTIAEYSVIYLLPNSSNYQLFKYEHTPDFEPETKEGQSCLDQVLQEREKERAQVLLTFAESNDPQADSTLSHESPHMQTDKQNTQPRKGKKSKRS